jgi:hypothetical protein
MREEAAAAAPASASGGTASSGPSCAPLAATRLSYARPGDWTIRNAPDGTHLYHADPKAAVLRLALEPASSTPEQRARQEAASLSARGATVGPLEVGGNYASFSWQGDLGSGPRHGRVAVRRPARFPGSLIVMSGFWTPAADDLSEQVDLLFLTASAE